MSELRSPLFISLVLQVAQQFSGINAVSTIIKNHEFIFLVQYGLWNLQLQRTIILYFLPVKVKCKPDPNQVVNIVYNINLNRWNLST